MRLGLTGGKTDDGQVADRLLDHLDPRTIMLAGKAVILGERHRITECL